ncbi:MAG: CCA tRNA nucleotidyltransferase [Lachnospiraceae bacterium]|nr:CCA tRNA nucleotidyltransferase [Lachnospiraceae bacterium]
MQIQIPEQVREIIQKLNQNGYEAYAVGGCVRDTLLGREPEDWDITTSALPLQVKALFRRTVDTGIQHGTVTIMVGRTGYEVTTYRIDGTYEDGRHPKEVAFTSDLLEDLRRRDFTINAMAYSEETGIVDAFDGMQDLKRRTIRCVGNAMERFTEDALRILRAIRFSAQLDFTIEQETQEAIAVIAPNIARVSKERIQMELSKLLVSAHPEQIRQVYETGISPFISEGFAAVPWRKTDIPADLPAVKYVRWAAFLRLVRPEQAVRILKDLKLDNDTIARVRTLVGWSGRELAAEAEAVRRAMSQMEPEVWDALVELNGYDAAIRALTAQIRAAGDCLLLKDLAVKGKDLIEAGVKPGRALGEILERMLDHVLAYPGDNQKEVLLEKFCGQ